MKQFAQGNTKQHFMNNLQSFSTEWGNKCEENFVYADLEMLITKFLFASQAEAYSLLFVAYTTFHLLSLTMQSRLCFAATDGDIRCQPWVFQAVHFSEKYKYI